MVAGTAGAQPERHLAFAAFGEGSLAKSDVITSSLGTINFATPGFLEPRPVAGVRFDALITSGAQSAPIPTAMLHAAVTPEALRQGFKPTGRRYVVAARVSGLLPSAFPTGPPAGVDAAARHLVRAVRPANLVVVADTDFLADLMWVRTTTVFGERVAEPWANNGDFVLNALDNLTGSADLLGIRGRPIFSRPFTRVDRLRTRADERLRGKAAELEARLADTERKLAALQNRREDRQALTLSPEQQREVDRFRQQKIEIRKQLRAVRRDLDEQIDALGTRLKAINVVAMPVVVSLFALATALFARRRRRARGDAA